MTATEGLFRCSAMLLWELKTNFDHLLETMKDKKGAELDTDLDADDLKKLVGQYKDLYKKEKGAEFPQDPKEQLIKAVEAVFRSWNNPRAIYYRRMNDIPSEWGTAVNVQEMVYGNMVKIQVPCCITRNPSTGDKNYTVSFTNAQGEDVVAGIRTPQSIDHLRDINPEV